MSRLSSIRPSNLVLLAAAPFIVYLFATSSKYLRSLTAILGIGDNAGPIFIGFLLVLFVAILGYLSARAARFSDAAPRCLRIIAAVALPAAAALAVLSFVAPHTLMPFAESVFFHALSENTSTLIDRSSQPWVLFPDVVARVQLGLQVILMVYAFLIAAIAASGHLPSKVQAITQLGFEILTGATLFYLLFMAHWQFATGVAITFRAAIFAYIFAAILGLIWVGLQSFKPKTRTTVVYGSISLTLLAVSAFFFMQPQDNYVLVGSTEARIAIVRGTPQAQADIIRFGEFEGGGEQKYRIRSATDPASALEQIETIDSVSGAFVPVETHTQGYPVIWQTSFLPDKYRNPALTFAVLGFLLLTLTVGGAQHELHPLAVGSEFFVDTIRGIPMLVIILYIGLPLAGAVKDATGGGIDMTNMTRGVIAISVGYSAYMAEIFRSGIEAIPRGQIEAGGSLGLSRWQTARLIILPQALRIVTPPLGNEFIAMIKDTSLLSILSVRDMTQRMREFQAASFLPFAPFNTAAILYVVITLGCASFLKWIERRTAREDR
ncbi:amino acid ABC transporter permease [Ruegeria sp. Ofav3-42]|uniref:amino acid ABC transporter permease n=1 Tax=Ruegeria sp. Ofav3-42 TaxID=2917759 RepID=UPI001EF4D2F0|nr:amino acid ABC transporter permease [Ruegeria sp. Ofav3-42]MCG7520008.1 amino acid ABC transporter permease [Ruegeria sp. Ofav3-42]